MQRSCPSLVQIVKAGLQAHLLEIVQFAQQGEFVRANDSYKCGHWMSRMAHFGVTMVGIHARIRRTKIAMPNVVHIARHEQ
jgi:hypothetical protein